MRGSASWLSVAVVFAVIVPLAVFWVRTWLAERRTYQEVTTVRCRQRNNKLVQVRVSRDAATSAPLGILACSDSPQMRCNRACLPLLVRLGLKRAAESGGHAAS